MKQFIDYLNTHLNQHPNLDITLRVLVCLDYIENNIDEIAKHAGKESLLRHPEKHLAFHLACFSTPNMAKDQLLKLVAEVKGCLTEFLAIEDPVLKKAVINSFLLNINDSDAGCMEARLRPALMYYGLYKSHGSPKID